MSAVESVFLTERTKSILVAFQKWQTKSLVVSRTNASLLIPYQAKSNPTSPSPLPPPPHSPLSSFLILLLPSLISQTIFKLLYISLLTSKFTQHNTLKILASKSSTPPSSVTVISSGYSTEILISAISFSLTKVLLFSGSYISSSSTEYDVTSTSTISNFQDLDTVLILQSCNNLPSYWNVSILSALFSIHDILNFIYLHHAVSNPSQPTLNYYNISTLTLIHLLISSITLSNNCEIYLPVIGVAVCGMGGCRYWIWKKEEREGGVNELRMSLSQNPVS